MNIDEAKRWLNELRVNCKSKYLTESEEVSEAYDMAIKALESQSWSKLPEPPEVK